MEEFPVARIQPDTAFGFSNGGWTLDAYPDLESLDAGKAMTVGVFEGPGVIHRIHTTQHGLPPDGDGVAEMTEEEKRALVSRGVVIEVYYNGCETPSVRVPLADFFLDGCGGRCADYSTVYFEKAPESYNCFVPVPFAESARVVLRNDTPYNLLNYSYVEWSPLPAWQDDLGHFHATWRRDAFQLTGATDRVFFRVEGCGHLLGRSFSIASDDPLFTGQAFIMEGNNEFRVDGEDEPRADYLGTEDAFGMSWGWPRRFIGLRNGAAFVQHDGPGLISTYNLRESNVLRFRRSLELRIDWTHEFPGNTKYHDMLAQRLAAGGCWVDYAVAYYWYQRDVGYRHAPLPSIEDRTRTVLRPNPPEPDLRP